MTIPAILLALAVLSTERAAGQTPFVFTLDFASSSFSWSGSTNLGALTGASQAFGLHGAVGLDVSADAQGIHTGRFLGADASIQPDILGEFASGPANPFEITGARLSFVSDTFAIAPDGSFTVTLTPSFLDGDLSMVPPVGIPSFSPLDGLALQPVVVNGMLTQSGSTLRLVVPVVFVFNFTVGAVTGSLTMVGTVAADLDCPDPVSYCAASPNSVGPGAVIANVGTPSVSTNQLVLEVSGLPALQNGIFFYGVNSVKMPFGNGVLCVGAPQFRLPVVATTLSGDAAYPLDIGSPPSPSGQIVPGATWSFQFWYRDPAAGGAFFNLSNGVRLFFCP